jgi:ubiquitin-conjugating enzyme E2 Q
MASSRVLLKVLQDLSKEGIVAPEPGQNEADDAQQRQEKRDDRFPFRVSTVGSHVHRWHVRFPAAGFVDAWTPLANDLDKYAAKYNKEPAILLELSFPRRFPSSPPFARVIRPRFAFHTGHVTVGGSICVEVSEWLGCRGLSRH